MFHLAVLPLEISQAAGSILLFTTLIIYCSHNHLQVEYVCALIHSGPAYLEVSTLGGQQCHFKFVSRPITSQNADSFVGK